MDPLRIVAIGGGTGLSTILRGLKPFAHEPRQVDITAVVTVTDDGGSSGRLRREFDVLPPGDIRNCMVALSEDEALLSKLFQYRFTSGHGLKGHSFGNLFLMALTNLTGDFAVAVKMSSEILASAGRIYPATAQNVVLEADLANGKTVCGETRISKSRSPIKTLRLQPCVCKPLPETLDAIAQADLITFGPGSLYTSIIPNLLVKGIPQAIRRSRALKAYFVNLMWQPGETTGFRASDHLRAIARHAGGMLVDVAIINSGRISAAQRRAYAAEEAHQVEADLDAIEAMRVRVVLTDLLARREKIRHDPELAAAVVMDLARSARARDAVLQFPVKGRRTR